MARKTRKLDVDLEVDLHGHTAEEMRSLLQHEWPSWRGMRRVRLIHGRGDVLKRELEIWCREMGIPFEIEPNNPGSARIYPTERTIPDAQLRTFLKDKGLRLTPEEEAYLRDPEAVHKARLDELAKRQTEERNRKKDETTKLLERRRDDALWQAEVARLDGMEKRRTGKAVGDAKPNAPVIRPPSDIKHQEGWWRAELVRVADTDTDTLQVQKRTGLEKLAPPITAQKPAEAPKAAGYRKPNRDTAADQALFEAEMARLEED